MTDMEKADQLIKGYGDEAYQKAVEFTVMAVNLGDDVGAEMFAGAAKVLLQRGYHKKNHEKSSQENNEGK